MYSGFIHTPNRLNWYKALKRVIEWNEDRLASCVHYHVHVHRFIYLAVRFNLVAWEFFVYAGDMISGYSGKFQKMQIYLKINLYQ